MTVAELIEELNKIEDTTLEVVDSANDNIDSVLVEECFDNKYVRIF